MSVGKRIKELRINQGLTLREVAKKIGVATQTIHKYENEIVTNIPIDRIEEIAKVLNTNIIALFCEDEEDYKKTDAIADIFIRLEKDKLFFEVVQVLDSIDNNQLEGIKAMLLLLKNNNSKQ